MMKKAPKYKFGILETPSFIGESLERETPLDHGSSDTTSQWTVRADQGSSGTTTPWTVRTDQGSSDTTTPWTVRADHESSDTTTPWTVRADQGSSGTTTPWTVRTDQGSSDTTTPWTVRADHESSDTTTPWTVRADQGSSDTTTPWNVRAGHESSDTTSPSPWTLSRTSSAFTSNTTFSSRFGAGSAVYPIPRASSGCSTSSLSTPKSHGFPRTPRSRTPRSRTPTSGRSGATPRTSSASRTLCSTTPRTFSESSTVVALVEGRGLARGEVGIASLDLKSPELVLSQFPDTTTYVKTITKLQILNPLEIVLPNTACQGSTMTSLSKIINDQFPTITVVTVQRKYFNEKKGLQYVKQLCVPEYSSVELEVSAKYYCLAAGAALMNYTEFIQNTVFAPASLKVIFKGSENTTMIDMATVCNLELLQNRRDPHSSHSLYGILNYTKTAGGARLLRSNIIQPSSDVETITMRQDVVAELIEKEEIFYNLQSIIARFLDIDHILSMCVHVPKVETAKTAESKINTVIYLKHALELVAPLREALAHCENPFLKTSYQLLADPRFELMLNKINCIIHEDARYQKGSLNMRSQKCFAVKPNINGLLDLSRKTYTEIVDDISNFVEQMKATYNLPFKIAHNGTRNFYMQLHAADGYATDNLPGVCIKVTKFRNTFSFTTPDLIIMNDRVKESLNDIYDMSSIVMSEVLDGIRSEIGCLYKLSETVSYIDMLVAFTHACTVSDYVRPEFTDTLAFKQGRHPILEKIQVEPAIPNNMYASEDSNFMIITGPNMSGKSTYLRQTALLQIMAQIGSYVPAEYASFRVADQIFSRIGSDDDMETNSSTFMLEMKEINYIIQSATPNSLIIIDELGRGTSPDEGVGLCFAICEHLLKLKAFTFFVTHFMELTRLDTMYPNVENYHFEVQRKYSAEANCEKVIYTHVLSKGKTEEKHYGIQLAELSTLPRSVIDGAKQLAHKIAEQRKGQDQSDPEAVRRRAKLKLATRLVQAARNSSRLDEDTLRQYLMNLKDVYLNDITDLPQEE